jgi:hypothetical protein
MVASIKLIELNSIRYSNGSWLGFGKSLCRLAVIVLSFLTLCSTARAQTEKDASEPITAEDIADAVEAVNAVKTNKAKLQIYCEWSDLQEEAEEKAATNKRAAEALEARADKLLERLGEDFGDAVEIEDELAENSPLGAPLFAAFEELEEICEKLDQ